MSEIETYLKINPKPATTAKLRRCSSSGDYVEAQQQQDNVGSAAVEHGSVAIAGTCGKRSSRTWKCSNRMSQLRRVQQQGVELRRVQQDMEAFAGAAGCGRLEA